MKFDLFSRVAATQTAPTSEPSEKSDVLLFLPPPTQPYERLVREMSPREVAAFAYESYLCGALDWDEYRMLGFPAELHPAFDHTIGALTGEKAEPDRPRDVLADWRGRLSFAYRHNADDYELIRRIERILEMLK